MKRSISLIVVLIIQVICAIAYLINLLSTVTGFAQLSWMVHELIEIGAVFGLVLGIVITALMVRRQAKRLGQVEDQLRAASGAFMELLDDKFNQWTLTPAERDVALFAIKGMSTAEMAGLRGVSEGTIKAQTNAIYRKAGVTGRPQLLSLFIDDLMDDALIPQVTSSGSA